MIPIYMFSHDYEEFYTYLSSIPHRERHFQSDEAIWHLGEPLTNIYYFESGIAKTVIRHENGRQKLAYFHGKGTISPCAHATVFQLDLSIVMQAITPVDTLEFALDDFMSALRGNINLALRLIEVYAHVVNIGLFEGATQPYNDMKTTLCNLLYLLKKGSPRSRQVIQLSQQSIADILCTDRAYVARYLSQLKKEGIITSRRGKIEVVDDEKLLNYCTSDLTETL